MANKLQRIMYRFFWFLTNPLRIFVLVFRRFFPKDTEVTRLASWTFGNVPRVPLTKLFPGSEQTDISLLKVYDRVVGTSIDVLELAIILTLLVRRKPKNILEIGTYDGNTTLNLAANAPDGSRITTVDLPPDFKGPSALKIPKSYINVIDMEQNKVEIGRQFKNSPYEKKIKQVFGDSAALDWDTLSPPFDFIFLDGCHHYSYVKHDTQNAIKYLAPGGIILWHDYAIMQDVSKAVDEFRAQMEINCICGTRLAIGLKR